MNPGLRPRLSSIARFVIRIPRILLVAVFRVYQLLISPLLSGMSPSAYGQTCRFYPSCSEYALVAVDRYGVLRGGRLAIWRLLRCNPWNPGGVDHVPPVAGHSDAPGDHTAPEHPEHPHLSDQARAVRPAAVDGPAEKGTVQYAAVPDRRVA